MKTLANKKTNPKSFNHLSEKNSGIKYLVGIDFYLSFVTCFNKCSVHSFRIKEH